MTNERGHAWHLHQHGGAHQAQQQQQQHAQKPAFAAGDYITDAEFEKMFGRVGAEGKLIPVDPKPAGDRESHQVQRPAGGSDPQPGNHPHPTARPMAQRAAGELDSQPQPGNLPHPTARPQQRAAGELDSQPGNLPHPTARPRVAGELDSQLGSFPNPTIRPQEQRADDSQPGNFPHPTARPRAAGEPDSQPGSFPNPTIRPQEQRAVGEQDSQPGNFPHPTARPRAAGEPDSSQPGSFPNPTIRPQEQRAVGESDSQTGSSPHPTPRPQGQKAAGELDSQPGDGPRQPTPNQQEPQPENKRTDQPPVPGQFQGYGNPYPNQQPPYQGYGPNDGYYPGPGFQPGYDPRFQRPYYPQQGYYPGEPQVYGYGYYQGRREGGEPGFQPGFDARYQRPYYPGEPQGFEPPYPNPRPPYGGYGPIPGGGNPPLLPNPDVNPPQYDEEYASASGYGIGGRGASQQPHQFSHLPQMAQAHDDNTDPELFEQAAHQLHRTTSQAQHAPFAKSDYQAHMAAHEQAYGPNSQKSDAPMDSESIGSAAAIEAFKMMTAAQSPSPAPSPQPQAAKQSTAQDQPSAKKSSAPAADASPAGPSRPGPSSPQDKIVAVAMAQAAKLFDKKNGGKPSNPAASQAKLKAVQSAASTAFRLANEYKTSGKVALQPGELQSLISTALSIL